MKRMIAIAAASVLCLLMGCGTTVTAEEIQTRYDCIAAAEMTARVVYHLEGESRDYVLCCSLDGQNATVTVTEPEELEGISAVISTDGLAIDYEGIMLSTGDPEDICPANCLPYLLRAISEGYVLEQGKEMLGSTECWRLSLDTTAKSGEKVLCIAWLDGENLMPRYAEFSQNNQVVLTVEILSFVCTLTEE